jgi:hypothetical protein
LPDDCVNPFSQSKFTLEYPDAFAGNVSDNPRRRPLGRHYQLAGPSHLDPLINYKFANVFGAKRKEQAT